MTLIYQELITRMTLEEKVALCSGADSWTTKPYGKYGIPSIFMSDGPHGLRKTTGEVDNMVAPSIPATCFPTASATACSWDRDLLREMGEALAEEALQEGVSLILGPGVNLKRNPLCGRNFEYFSEDPYLAGEMAVSWIDGAQKKGVGVSLKHFAANNQENQRMQSDSIIDERTLREMYLPAFEIAVKQTHPATIMCAYNQLNGTFCSDNRYLLRDILRSEWGFEGVIVTDWGAMNDRVKAFEAGLDLEMPGSAGYFDRTVIGAVKNGELAEQRVDECVDRLLELIFTAHKKLQPGYHYDAVGHHNLARKIAAQSAVLLKNDDHILPLPRGGKIAVIGALAAHPRFQGAGSSFINPTQLSSAVDGFKAQGVNYFYYPGYVLKGSVHGSLLQEAVAGAKDCDIAVIFAGLPAEYESEGFDRVNLQMPPSHNELIEKVAAANPNTVVVLAGGAPVEMPWLRKVKAVLHMYLPGQAGGLAVVDLLTGTSNPSGKLAESYPLSYAHVPSAGFYEDGGKQAQYREGIYVGYRYYDKAGVKVAFPFGYGLSYTNFEYRDLTLSRTDMQTGDELTVTATIQNTGTVDGAEVVQLYVSDLQQTAFRPEKELKGFAKVFLKAGEAKQITCILNSRSFALYDPSSKAWIVPGGPYAISIAASSRDIRLQQSIILHGSPHSDSSAEKPGWYANPSGQATQSDFEQLLGRPIEPLKKPRKGEYTLSCSLRDMEGSFVIRRVIRSIGKMVAKMFGGSDTRNPNLRMALDSATTMPLKKLTMMQPSSMPANVSQGIVHLANGHYLKGLGSFLKKGKN